MRVTAMQARSPARAQSPRWRGRAPRRAGFRSGHRPFSAFPATFAGQPVDATSILIRYTVYGDADLSGNVNLNDFNKLAANFGAAAAAALPALPGSNDELTNELA